MLLWDRFATFDDPAALLQPPSVQLRLAHREAETEAQRHREAPEPERDEASVVTTVHGVTHVYRLVSRYE